MTLKLLAAAAVLTTAITSPALAMGPHARSEAVQLQQQRAQAQRDAQVRRDNGFWPGDIAAGVVGGAAGAIATVPLRHMVMPITAMTDRMDTAAALSVSRARPSSARTDCGTSANSE
jgi:hypothetical protein